MSVAATQTLTVDQFLAWEDRQEMRHEFDGNSIVAMTGGTIAHSSIQAALLRTLGNHLRGKPCRPHGGEAKIKMAASVRYADAFVICTPLAPSATFVTDPVVVFEILSKSTGNDDLGDKRAEYEATPSVQRYVVLQQSHRAAQVFYRNGDRWEVEFHLGDTAILGMPEIDIAIPLAEIYEGIILESDLHDQRGVGNP